MPTLTAYLIGYGLVFLLILVLHLRGAKRPIRSPTLLESKVFAFPDGTVQTVAHMLEGTSVMGRSGGGKTSGPGAFLDRHILAHPMSSMLWLASKPEEKQAAIDLCRRYGRRLRIVEPGGDSINLIEQLAGDSAEVTHLLTTVMDSIKGTKAGRTEPFWDQANERAIENSVVPLGLAGQLSVPNIQQFLLSAPIDKAALDSPKARDSFHGRIMRLAEGAAKTEVDRFGLKQSMDFFGSEFPYMDMKLQSGILAGVLGLCHTLNSGMVRQICSAGTTCPLSELDRGTVILVNTSPLSHGVSGKVVEVGIKYIAQRYLLRRRDWRHWVIIKCDEYQEVAVEPDVTFLCASRSHGASMCVLTQNLANYHIKMGDKFAESLLGNTALKIFTELGHAQDAQFASSLVGKYLETFISVSHPGDQESYDILAGRSKVGMSYSQQYQDVIKPEVLMHGFRVGGGANGYLVDTLNVRHGARFRDGNSYQWVTYDQRAT